MKRLFFLLTMCVCVSIGAWGQTVTIDLSSTTLADWLVNHTETYSVINITGEISADDVKQLKNLKATNILMNQATVADDAVNADFAFSNTIIENIVLPNGLDMVKDEWFSGCSNLNAAISYSNGGKTVKAYVNKAGMLYATMNTLSLNGTASELPSNAIEEAILSGNITKEDLTNQYGTTNAFYGCHIKHYDLSRATLSSSDDLKYAGNDGWAGTDYLEQLELPLNLTAIPAQCFQGCSHLKTLYLPSTITSIGAQAFSMCNELETIEFAKGFTTLSFENDVFAQSKSLKHIVLPEGLESIGNGMFDQCVNLESLRLPNSLKHIGENAFRQCSSLTYLTIPSGVETIGSDAFAVSGIQDIYLMAQTVEDLPYIASDAFGSTPFTGNSSLAINGDHIDLIVDRVVKLVERGVVTEVTVEQVQAWGANWKDGQYRVNDMPDKNILKYVPTEEMEQLYRDFVGYSDPIAYLHYPKVENDGKTATKLSMFIDGNPWSGQTGILDGLGGFYSRGQLDENGIYFNTNPAASLRTRDVESPRLAGATHLSDAYGIGPDADGNYWPDTNHSDQWLRTQYAEMDNWTEDETTISESNDPYNGKYMGYSKYYWRNFLLQSGYSPVNDEVYSKYYDDTWYTMCFPFDLTDEQLEAAYQSNKFNICEFSSASIYPETKTDDNGEDVEVKNLVLCFTKIARTWYKDKYGNYYERTRDNDQNQTKHYKKADRTWVEKSDGTADWDLTNISSTELSNNGDDADIWESIDGYLALAGHPYMIHPYRVENLDGTATLCNIPKVVYKYDFNKRTSETLTEITSKINQLYEDEAVTRPICEVPDKDITIYEKEWDAITKGDGKNEEYGRYNQMTKTDNGTYTFKGTFLPATDDVVVAGEPTEKVIPYGAYFLGVDPNGATANDRKYPKFWRETSTNTARPSGLWKQYSAIIIPDAAAAAWETENLVPDGTVTGAKGVHMMFGDFEEVTTTDINEIVADAVKKGQKVEKVNVIVNINGQVVRQGTDVKGLPRGLYIVNGKKYMVK